MDWDGLARERIREVTERERARTNNPANPGQSQPLKLLWSHRQNTADHTRAWYALYRVCWGILRLRRPVVGFVNTKTTDQIVGGRQMGWGWRKSMVLDVTDPTERNRWFYSVDVHSGANADLKRNIKDVMKERNGWSSASCKCECVTKCILHFFKSTVTLFWRHFVQETSFFFHGQRECGVLCSQEGV